MQHFLHIESSGYGAGSYPIEVGVVLADGQAHCTLIYPQDDWTVWHGASEDLHGISRDILLVKGKSALKVAMLLNEWLDGETVYSEAWGNHHCWLDSLFRAAGVRRRFIIDAIESLLPVEQVESWSESKQLVARSLDMTRRRASRQALLRQKTLQSLLIDG